MYNRGLRLEEMSWRQIRDSILAGRTTVIVPCGSFEQHGPHLPLGTDAILAEEIALRAAALTENALVAPSVRPALSEHHMQFPATVTLRPETFVSLIQDYVTSLAQHGFKRIVIFTAHGGNEDVLRAFLPFWAKLVGDRCEVCFSSLSPQDREAQREILSRRGISQAKGGVHAGYSETSSLLSARPGLVAMEAASAGMVDDSFYELTNRDSARRDLFIRGTQAFSDIGVLGDPTGANREAGAELLAVAARSLARDLQKAPVTANLP